MYAGSNTCASPVSLYVPIHTLPSRFKIDLSHRKDISGITNDILTGEWVEGGYRACYEGLL